MADLETVCCMCGDIGFPDKLFRCNKCHHRFQHSYCSNYYTESIRSIEQCDWCQSEKRSTKHGGSAKKSVAGDETATTTSRSENPGYKIKRHDREGSSEKGKSSSGLPSPRTATRRYKLLKDVLC
ncbi:unnamed protein product [Ilex paraguariensis]|uniref:PHD-type zinc finger plants domain-containing protein n=1 Tax=Ilex paraguariensis TaxID=185542 RepID=A0ABC8V4X7_9AQUA